MKKISATVLGMILFGCASAPSNPPVESTLEPVPAPVAVTAVVQPVVPKKDFTSADMRRTVNTAVYNMLKSGTLDNADGDKYVVVVGRVVNTTGKDDFDTEQTVQYLKSALASGRKVRVVSAKSKTAPQFFIAGKITHRTAHLAGKKKRQEYYLHLFVTEATTGSRLWDAPFPIVHRETAKGKSSK